MSIDWTNVRLIDLGYEEMLQLGLASLRVTMELEQVLLYRLVALLVSLHMVF